MGFQEPWQLLQAWGPKSAGSEIPEPCLLVLGYLEPQKLLQEWGYQAFGQWEFWGLLSRCGVQKGSAIALQA
jgi:hypothetical protein